MIGESALFKTVGQVAGIAGICVGALTLIFRDIVRKKIFPSLASPDAYKLLRLIIVCSWTVAIAGMITWAYLQKAPALGPDSSQTGGSQSQPESSLEITGSVIDASTNLSIPQATVSLAGVDTTPVVTDDNGNFAISVKPTEQEAAGGYVRLRVSKDGYRTADSTIVAPARQLILSLHR